MTFNTSDRELLIAICEHIGYVPDTQVLIDDIAKDYGMNKNYLCTKAKQLGIIEDYKGDKRKKAVRQVNVKQLIK